MSFEIEEGKLKIKVRGWVSLSYNLISKRPVSDKKFRHHREQFICKFGSQFYHQTLVVEQCTLQIYIEQVITASKFYTRFFGSLINACNSLCV